MANRIEALLAPLAEYRDRLICCPMTAEEINAYAEDLGMPIPTIYQEYLEAVGIKQDFISSVFTDPWKPLEEHEWILDMMEEIPEDERGVWAIGKA